MREYSLTFKLFNGVFITVFDSLMIIAELSSKPLLVIFLVNEKTLQLTKFYDKKLTRRRDSQT